MDERLIIFTRYPEPHQSKTRLIPALGPEGAAALHREMTRHTLRRARRLAAARPLSLEVHFEGGGQARMQQCFGSDVLYRPQSEGDLGRRLQAAFESAFRAGIRRTVIVGSDCPGITAQTLRRALDRLRHVDLVLGPADDGGYYLIGLRRPAPQLFAHIPWGSSQVLRETLHVARRTDLSTSLLAQLPDVDRPEDLKFWHRAKSRFPAGAAEARISVIIPTLNEAACLEKTLRCLQAASGLECIVADGGSRDRTVSIAEACGCRVVLARAGRGRQMNAGAAAATGSILLFLHADTRLPKRFDAHIRRALGRPGVVAGAFQLRIDGPVGQLRVIETGANLRARFLRMPYGDQAIFVPVDLFYCAGRFPELPILEDFELMRRLRRRGRVAIVAAPVVTSARRWQALGPWRTTWINQMVILGYFLGISPQRLSRWYQGRKSPLR